MSEPVRNHYNLPYRDNSYQLDWEELRYNGVRCGTADFAKAILEFAARLCEREIVKPDWDQSSERSNTTARICATVIRNAMNDPPG